MTNPPDYEFRIIVLTDNNIKLRGFDFEDAVTIARLCDNPKIWNNLRDYVPSPYGLKDAEDFITHCLVEHPQTTFAIEYEGELVGVIGLETQSDVYKLTAEIGYWIGEDYWNLGISTRAIRLISEYGFSQLGLVRIFAGVFDYNKASQRVLEKAGFHLEGVLRKALFKNNQIFDEYRYALIKEDA